VYYELFKKKPPKIIKGSKSAGAIPVATSAFGVIIESCMPLVVGQMNSEV
jgi:hypothetical protein